MVAARSILQKTTSFSCAPLAELLHDLAIVFLDLLSACRIMSSSNELKIAHPPDHARRLVDVIKCYRLQTRLGGDSNDTMHGVIDSPPSTRPHEWSTLGLQGMR